jgi:hypothetical protein
MVAKPSNWHAGPQEMETLVVLLELGEVVVEEEDDVVVLVIELLVELVVVQGRGGKGCTQLRKHVSGQVRRKSGLICRRTLSLLSLLHPSVFPQLQKLRQSSVSSVVLY